MRMIKHLRILLLTLLLALVVACSAGNVRDESNPDENKDLLQIRTEADAAYKADDIALAEKHYERLVRELPVEAEHWFRLGNIYVRTNRPYAAMNLYREAVVRDPEFAKAWYNLGIVQLKQTAFSLNEMLLYTDINDPLYDKARRMLDDIEAIIEE